MLHNNSTHLSSLKHNVPPKIFASFLFIKLCNQTSQPASLHEVQAGSWHQLALLIGDIVLLPYESVRNKISLFIPLNYFSSF